MMESLPTDRMLFLTHSGSRPYKATTFGNWFHDQCIAAGLPHCSSTPLATEFEIMAFLGHKTTDKARTYTKKANRKSLSDSGLGKVERAKKEQALSNPVKRLDIDPAQHIEKAEQPETGGTPKGNNLRTPLCPAGHLPSRAEIVHFVVTAVTPPRQPSCSRPRGSTPSARCRCLPAA